MSNPLHESMVIIPKHDNSGRDLAPLTRDIAAELVSAFGGVTESDARGLWNNGGRSYNEPVTELVTAAPDDNRTDATLRRVAAEINRDGKQVATYTRFPDGHVELIRPSNSVFHISRRDGRAVANVRR